MFTDLNKIESAGLQKTLVANYGEDINYGSGVNIKESVSGTGGNQNRSNRIYHIENNKIIKIYFILITVNYIN